MECARCKKMHRGIKGLFPVKTGKKTPAYWMLCKECMQAKNDYEKRQADADHPRTSNR